MKIHELIADPQNFIPPGGPRAKRKSRHRVSEFSPQAVKFSFAGAAHRLYFDKTRDLHEQNLPWSVYYKIQDRYDWRKTLEAINDMNHEQALALAKELDI